MLQIRVSSHAPRELIDITSDVQKIVDQHHMREGILILFVPHTTAGITINEGADPSVQHDILMVLEKLIPRTTSFHHAEGNSDAHVATSLFGSSVTVPVEQGKLVLGTWQHIFLFEGDGPRTRSVYISLLKQ